MQGALATLPIVVYPDKSVETSEISDIIGELDERHPDWKEGSVIGPFVMIPRVEAQEGLRLNRENIAELTNQIELIIAALSRNHRKPYRYFIRKLKRHDAVRKVDVPRAIEFLALAFCRYVLDQIRQRCGGEESFLQGFVLGSKLLPPDPSRNNQSWVSTELLIFHDLGNKLDGLMMECLKLGEEKVTKIIGRVPMDLIHILDIKVEKYQPCTKSQDPI